MSFSQIPWFFLCGGLTAVGLVGSWIALRRRGAKAALRGVAWSLLPIAAYLVGVLQVLWRFGIAIGDFFSGLAFSPKVWSGVIIAGVSVVLFAVTGGLRGRARRKRAKTEQDSQPPPPRALATAPPTPTTVSRRAAPVPAKRKGGGAAADDDFGEVADILKRHGIS